MIGITAYGAYLPRLRLERMSIFQNMGWFAPAIVMVAQGERSMCNWDEDALTMAVAASQDCLQGRNKKALDALYLASTTLPFADRQNAGIVATALNLRDDILTADFSASQKSGTTALINALEVVRGGDKHNILVTATDKRETKAAYFYEMWFGDGAASVMVGDSPDGVIAQYEGSFSVSYDFVDHYRGAFNRYDYVWEERWARDEGYSKIIPEAVEGLLSKLSMDMGSIDHLVFPCIFKAEHGKIAQKLGADPEIVHPNLHEECGETGNAHSLLMLAGALEKSRPGERILVAGFGQGCNALCFRVTENITDLAPRRGLTGCLENKKSIDNYPKWLRFRNLMQTEMGIRAEAPTQTAMTTLWRQRKMILGLVGGKCRECQTPQFPKMDICVNPDCGAHHSQDDYEFSDKPARIKTFTGDLLAVSMDPPHKYGMIQFDDGGRFMADFTDCDLDDLRVGLPIQLSFRKRTEDKERGFVNYFWKAIPDTSALADLDRIDFTGRVAVVTGAGGGLGRTYALELAKHGAKVVVNDLGGARDGSGEGSPSPADAVVAEIKALGGEAVSNYDSVASVDGGEAIVKTALDNYDRLDILINNAGILRDKSFAKMEADNWQAVLDVHLGGAYNVTRPAFAAMKRGGFGRIVMTTSAAGLYGNFGQTNYSAAKMGLVGLMNTLKIEGRKYNIKINTVAPMAASRLTEDILPPDIFAKMKPEYVAPVVLYLCSDVCDESGAILNTGMGYLSRAAILTGPAVQLGDEACPPTPEDMHANWEKINGLEGAKEMPDLTTALLDLIAPPTESDGDDDGQAAQSAEGPSVASIFAAMPEHFNAEAARGVTVTFQYRITGAKGGDWTVAVKDGTCEVVEGFAEAADCTLTIAAEDFVRLISGELNPMQAYTSGKLKIQGDIMKSQLIEKLFKLG
jgi:3-hydroxy-3-methylglutaryl CoA synthase/NAD(P)-dependent dehydrogenase (short-subunit alcohol dehydrogenase family)/putative sterol carrier protein